MSKNENGCQMITQNPISTYNFKWTVEHFSRLPFEKEITSPYFYPSFAGAKWYSTLKKSSSYLTWTMHNLTKQIVSVEYSITILDNSGKLWVEKVLHDTFKVIEHQNYNRGRTTVTREIKKQSTLLSSSDMINITDMCSSSKDVVTFTCLMTFSGYNTETETVGSESEIIDDMKHLEKLSNDFKTMYGVSLYTDVCLRIGNDSLRVHKAILCGRSPVFAKMFEHNLEEKETSVIEIADLDISVLKDLISFLYTAVVRNQDFDSVFCLYYAADKYEVEELVMLCGEILMSKINVENACQLLALANRHSNHNLKTSVLTFMDIHLDSILASDGWVNLATEETKLAVEVLNIRRDRSRQKCALGLLSFSWPLRKKE